MVSSATNEPLLLDRSLRLSVRIKGYCIKLPPARAPLGPEELHALEVDRSWFHKGPSFLLRICGFFQ